MRKKAAVVLAAAMLLALAFSGLALAGRGQGPGNGTGIGPCECGYLLDVDPVDGLCDICGGCIPQADGPHGPDGSGQGNGDCLRDGSCADEG